VGPHSSYNGVGRRDHRLLAALAALAGHFLPAPPQPVRKDISPP
jgi:hypothetical protein